MFMGGTPDAAKDMAMREDAAGVARQEGQKIELLRCQVDQILAQPDFVPGKVDEEVAVAHR